MLKNRAHKELFQHLSRLYNNANIEIRTDGIVISDYNFDKVSMDYEYMDIPPLTCPDIIKRITVYQHLFDFPKIGDGEIFMNDILTFRNCKFKLVYPEDSRLSDSILGLTFLDNCKISLNFEDCEFDIVSVYTSSETNIEFTNCQIGQLNLVAIPNDKKQVVKKASHIGMEKCYVNSGVKVITRNHWLEDEPNFDVRFVKLFAELCNFGTKSESSFDFAIQKNTIDEIELSDCTFLSRRSYATFLASGYTFIGTTGIECFNDSNIEEYNQIIRSGNNNRR